MKAAEFKVRRILNKVMTDFKDAADRLVCQQSNPEEFGDWSFVDSKRFEVPEGLHKIGGLLIHSVFIKPVEESSVQIEEIPITRYYNDEGREYFIAPEHTFKQKILQARVEAVAERIALDDRRRSTV